MKIETTMRYKFIPIRVAKIKKTESIVGQRGSRQSEVSHITGGNIQRYTHFVNQSGSFSMRILSLRCHNSNPKYLPKRKINICKKTCKRLLVEILIIVFKTGINKNEITLMSANHKRDVRVVQSQIQQYG